MHIRDYLPNDKENVLAMISKTIRKSNLKDYTQEQINIWSNLDEQKLEKSITNSVSLVAINSSNIVGFANMDANGYLDHLFVGHDSQHQGIATHLVQKLEKIIVTSEYSTYSSITAVPFFEKMGYQIVRPNQVLLHGIYFLNYQMNKTLS